MGDAAVHDTPTSGLIKNLNENLHGTNQNWRQGFYLLKMGTQSFPEKYYKN